MLIDCELEIVRMELEYPERFVPSTPPTLFAKTKLKWAGTHIEFVELVYALHEAGSFGNTPLKSLFSLVGQMFGCEITNYYRMFWNIKNRTGMERGYFLNKLMKKLSEKLVRMDSGERC